MLSNHLVEIIYGCILKPLNIAGMTHKVYIIWMRNLVNFKLIISERVDVKAIVDISR